MDAEKAPQFLDDCNEIFGFAVRDYGLSPGELAQPLFPKPSKRPKLP